MEEVNVGEVVEAIEILELADLAEFATKAVYSNKAGKKLYECTVEEARDEVKVKDQNKVKKEGIQALGLNLGRNLMSLGVIKEKATRLVVAEDKVASVTASLLAYVKAGKFDDEIALALAKTKATAEAQYDRAQNAEVADAATASEDVAGLDIDEI